MSDIQSVMVNPQGGLTFCDLSHGWRSDCAAGPLYPCYVEETIPGDYMTLSFSAEVKTEPAKAPTMGTYDCYIETFFCRMANYYSQLHTNLPDAPMLRPGVGSFHTFSAASGTPRLGSYLCCPGSLMEYMGFPGNARWWPYSTNPVTTNYNKPLPLVPFVAYYDIFRSWYCDPQWKTYYVGGYHLGDYGNFVYLGNDLSLLLQDLQDVYNSTTPISWSWDANDSPLLNLIMGPYDPEATASNSPLFTSAHHIGLVLGPYRADLMNNFISSDTVSSMLSRVSMNVVGSKLSFDQIVATEKIYEFDNRAVLSGGRYRDWVRAQYNVTPSTDLCQPQFLGRVHWTVGFQDVVANTAGTNQVLGDLGGRGFGQTSKTYPIRMGFTDNGYIISIFRIVPRLDYNGFVAPYLQRLTTEDIFTPAYDNSPFEPVYVTDVDARLATIASTGSNPLLLGYRPAWSSYRYRVNRSYGNFSLTTQSYWVLQRSFSLYDEDVDDDPMDRFSPYVLPSDADVPFARIGGDSRNFRVQIAVSSKWRRPIKANSLPSLK